MLRLGIESVNKVGQPYPFGASSRRMTHYSMSEHGYVLARPAGFENRLASKNSDIGLRDERRSSRNFLIKPRPRVAGDSSDGGSGNEPEKGFAGTGEYAGAAMKMDCWRKEDSIGSREEGKKERNGCPKRCPDRGEKKRAGFPFVSPIVALFLGVVAHCRHVAVCCLVCLFHQSHCTQWVHGT